MRDRFRKTRIFERNETPQRFWFWLRSQFKRLKVELLEGSSQAGNHGFGRELKMSWRKHFAEVAEKAADREASKKWD